MFGGFSRVLVVVLVLGSMSLNVTGPSYRSKAGPVKKRCILLKRCVLQSAAYRKKIQEKIEAPFAVASALPASLFAVKAGGIDPKGNGSGWLIPYGDPVFGSISLQL
jgi:hypothetical protein